MNMTDRPDFFPSFFLYSYSLNYSKCIHAHAFQLTNEDTLSRGEKMVPLSLLTCGLMDQLKHIRIEDDRSISIDRRIRKKEENAIHTYTSQINRRKRLTFLFFFFLLGDVTIWCLYCWCSSMKRKKKGKVVVGHSRLIDLLQFV